MAASGQGLCQGQPRPAGAGTRTDGYHELRTGSRPSVCTTRDLRGCRGRSPSAAGHSGAARSIQPGRKAAARCGRHWAAGLPRMRSSPREEDPMQAGSGEAVPMPQRRCARSPGCGRSRAAGAPGDCRRHGADVAFLLSGGTALGLGRGAEIYRWSTSRRTPLDRQAAVGCRRRGVFLVRRGQGRRRRESRSSRCCRCPGRTRRPDDQRPRSPRWSSPPRDCGAAQARSGRPVRWPRRCRERVGGVWRLFRSRGAAQRALRACRAAVPAPCWREASAAASSRRRSRPTAAEAAQTAAARSSN